MESYLMKVAFLDNRIGVTTSGTYSISVTETIGGCHSVGIDALLIVDKLREFWESSASTCLIHTKKMEMAKYQLQVQ